MQKLLSKNITIKQKLIFIIFFVGAIATISTIIVSSVIYVNSVKKEVVKQNKYSVEILAQDLAVPMIFGDTSAVIELVENFNIFNNFEGIGVYDNLHSFFCKKGEIDSGLLNKMSGNHESYLFTSNNLYFYSKIEQEKNIVGYLIVKFSLQPIKKGICDFIKLMMLLFFVLLIITYVLASNLQKIISEPILKLSDATKEITENYDFSRQIENVYGTEIGVLYDNFNNLIREVEQKSEENLVAMENVRVSEKKYRTIFEEALSGIFQLDGKGKIINSNNYFSKLLGYNNNEELKIRANDFVFNFLKDEQLWKRIVTSLKDNKTFKDELILFKENGEMINVITSLRPVYSYGELKFIEGVCEDITTRKKQELILKRAKKYVDNILESMPSAIISIDEKLKITHYNGVAKKYKDIAIGNSFFDVFPFFETQKSYIESLIEKREKGRLEKQIVKLDGSTYYNDINIYPLNEEQEDTVIRIDDVTDRVYFENMMIQTEKMMSLGGLAAGMAHEINNPLAGIMQNAQLVEMRIGRDLKKNVEVAKSIDLDLDLVQKYIHLRGIDNNIKYIRESGVRATNIVKDMLEFSRTSSKSFESTNVNNIIDKSIELLKTDFSMKKKYDFNDTKLSLDYKAKDSVVECVSNEIEQVLFNLVKNASQAMFMAKTIDPKIELSTTQGKSGVYIHIKDNGPGIPEKNLNRIFEPFYTTKEVGEGTGLGLSVSYFIITNNHHGMLSVNSSEGKGTEFIVYLPFKQDLNA